MTSNFVISTGRVPKLPAFGWFSYYAAAAGIWWVIANTATVLVGSESLRSVGGARFAWPGGPPVEYGPPESYPLLFWVFIVVAIVHLLLAVIAYIQINKTALDVYDNTIRGRGRGKWFKFWDLRLREFELDYANISSIDVKGSKLTIYGDGEKYIIYADNARDVADEISARLPIRAE